MSRWRGPRARVRAAGAGRPGPRPGAAPARHRLLLNSCLPSWTASSCPERAQVGHDLSRPDRKVVLKVLATPATRRRPVMAGQEPARCPALPCAGCPVRFKKIISVTWTPTKKCPAARGATKKCPAARGVTGKCSAALVVPWGHGRPSCTGGENRRDGGEVREGSVVLKCQQSRFQR